MPQLDFSVFPSQLFWLAVCFFAMLFIMSRFIIPKTAEMINLRKAKINGDLTRAAEIKQQVEQTLERYNQALHEANMRAAVSLQKTQDELNETVSRRQAELTARLTAEIENGEKKIAAAQERAMQKIEDASADLAAEVLKKLGFSGVKNKDALNALKTLKKD